MILLGNVISKLAMIMGAIRFCVGFWIASMEDPETRAFATARYLGSGTSGDAIDQGIYVFLFGLILGLLAKIAKSTARLET